MGGLSDQQSASTGSGTGLLEAVLDLRDARLERSPDFNGRRQPPNFDYGGVCGQASGR